MTQSIPPVPVVPSLLAVECNVQLLPPANKKSQKQIHFLVQQKKFTCPQATINITAVSFTE